jgi:hypothetical protein
MLTICKNDKEKVIEGLREGKLDKAAIAVPNIIDDIILNSYKRKLMELFDKVFIDRRSERNKQLPLKMIFTLAIAAKMKLKLSLTDIPYAIMDANTLLELGYNMYDTERDMENGIISDGLIRGFLKKYEGKDFINLYNNYAKEIFKTLDIDPNIHLLDCTKIEVNLKNENYEKSELLKDDDGNLKRGYKISTLRGLLDYSGVIEEIEVATIKDHDIKASENIILKSPYLKPGDILINDRGYVSRKNINILKNEKEIDVYMPIKSNMNLYKEAIKIAEENNLWLKHPNKKRKNQQISFVESVGCFWIEEEKTDVDLNACVVKDTKSDIYHVFITTDLSVSAKQIIKTYELRPEIEEDYRQLKDFWKLDKFKSTKYTDIVFHMVMTLIGYLYFQLFKDTEEGKKYERKSLPIIMKNYVCKKQKSVLIFYGESFGIFKFLEFIKLYSSLSAEVKVHLDFILDSV